MEQVVLLRGINVGGINIPMVDLRRSLTSAGFENVRTVLATGNVRLDSAMTGSQLKTAIEAVLSDRFGYEAWVVVSDVPTLRSVVERYPFDPARDGWHAYVVFGNDDTHLTELASVGDTLDAAVERIAPGESVVYWEVAKGSTTKSTFGRATSKVKYKPTTTTRNLRTLGKLLA